MATTYKVLGQITPIATTDTDLYTVPGLTSAVCSTLSICNRGITTTYRVAVRPIGAPISDEHYIIYESTINGNDSVFVTVGISLADSDVVTVYAGTNTVSFSLFGTEISAI